MDRNSLRADFVAMIRPLIRTEATREITDATLLVDDLNVNSARLVDIMLEMEDTFGIRIDDEEGGNLRTVGGAIDLILDKKRQAA